MTPTAALAKAQIPIASESATILIIEDYSDTRELLATMLRGKGYKVIEAEDGLEGLLKATAMYPDLIIMDLSLPEMDGVEAARRIHRQAKLAHIPIFVVSAYLTQDVKEDVSEAGCVEVFSKPFDAELLLTRISDRLGRT